MFMPDVNRMQDKEINRKNEKKVSSTVICSSITKTVNVSKSSTVNHYITSIGVKGFRTVGDSWFRLPRAG